MRNAGGIIAGYILSAPPFGFQTEGLLSRKQTEKLILVFNSNKVFGSLCILSPSRTCLAPICHSHEQQLLILVFTLNKAFTGN